MDKKLTFSLAPEGSHYAGTVLRRVMTVHGGQEFVLSETSTGQSLKEFKRQFPNEPVDGVYQSSVEDAVLRMSDAELDALGLSRTGEIPQKTDEKPEQEDLSPTEVFPKHVGAGTWECTDGTRFRYSKGGKDAAMEYEDALNETDSGIGEG